MLRGLALFGVLAINLDTTFRRNFFEQFLPEQHATLFDAIVWASLAFLVEFKAITIFSLLFGVGLGIQAEAFSRRGWASKVFVRRLIFLLAVGLIHFLLISNGDILTLYAAAGLCAVPFVLGSRTAHLGAMVVLFLLFLAMPWLLFPFGFPDSAWLMDHIAKAQQAYGSGNLADVVAFRISEAPYVGYFDLAIFPRTFFLFLFGAWLWRSRFIATAAADGRALVTAVLAIPLGLILTWLSGYGVPPPVALPLAAARMIDSLAAPTLAIGYSALILHLVGRSERVAWLNWAAPIGRMAFTNYLLQSVLLGLIFYGYGLGLFGKVGAASGLSLTILILVVQAWASAWWLRTHQYGPLEWVWRSFTLGQRQRWRAV